MQKLNSYLQVQENHFEICKKCEDLELEISRLIVTVSIDKRAAKQYKTAEGRKKNKFFLEKFSKTLKEKSNNLQKYAQIHVDYEE